MTTDAGAHAGAARLVPSPTGVESDSRAPASDLSSRLAEAVERVATMIDHGAAVAGHTLPPDFALERARNIVCALMDLFDTSLGE